MVLEIVCVITSKIIKIEDFDFNIFSDKIPNENISIYENSYKTLIGAKIIKTEDFDFNNILSDEKPYENILIYGNSYKTLLGANPLY